MNSNRKKKPLLADEAREAEKRDAEKKSSSKRTNTSEKYLFIHPFMFFRKANAKSA